MRSTKQLLRLMFVLHLAPAAGLGAGEPSMDYPQFPRLEVEALDRTMVVLPDSAGGFVTLLGFAFRMTLQNDLSKWLLAYADEFGGDSLFRAYEVPMMGNSGAVRFLRGAIDRGMRRSIPEHQHRFVLPVYADYRKFEAKLGMGNHGLVHMFLLDRQGRIRWRGQGPPSEGELVTLFARVRGLADEPDSGR
jgi:hypothetical protein